MSLIVVPWKEIVIDPMGNEREIVIDCEVKIDDIWKWCLFYNAQDNQEAPIKNSQSGKSGKSGKQKKEKTGGNKIGISKRLTTIERCKDSKDSSKKETCISNLVLSLRTFTGDSLSELVTHNLDRLREVSCMPEASKKDKEFLTKILSEANQ